MKGTKIRQEFDNYKVVDTLGHLVNRVAIVMRKRLTARFKEEGVELTPEEFAILCRLWEADGLFQTDISEKSLKDKTRITRLVGNLIKKSLVEKKTDERDRRNHQIFLTEKGLSYKYKVLPIVMEIMNQSSYQVSAKDLEITMKTLRKVFENINLGFLDN